MSDTQNVSEILRAEARQEICRDLEVHHYAQKHRHYHTWDHISDMYSMYRCFFKGSEEAMSEALYYAIAFHDSVYIPKSENNEKASAELFKVVWFNRTGLRVDPKLDAEVTYLIGRTTIASHFSPIPELVREAAILKDLDLSALSITYEKFSHTQLRIIREFMHLGDYPTIRKLHQQFLLQLLAAKEGKIYQTPEMSPLNEVAAANIRKFCGVLWC